VYGGRPRSLYKPIGCGGFTHGFQIYSTTVI
jgi:hypothetical protein